MISSLCLSVVMMASPVKAFYMGHSLATDIPDFLASFAKQKGYPFSFKEQNYPGAPLSMQWNEPKRRKPVDPQFGAYYDQFLSQGVNVFVLTDSVPRGDEWTVNDTTDHLTKFANFAKSTNPKMRVYYYEGWHCLNTGLPGGCEWDKSPNSKLKWVERLKADHAIWSRIVTNVNSKGYSVNLIPAGMAWHNLAKAVEARQIPGVGSVRDLFVDDIHSSVLGRVFVSMVHYAAIYGESPVGLTSQISDRWGRNIWKDKRFDKAICPEPSQATLKAMAKIAWDTVVAEPLSGLK